jgi:hypothetical protein
MKSLKTVLLVGTLVTAGAVAAAAQSGSSQGYMNSGAAAGGNISPATHCLDSNGVARLKSQAQGSGSAGGSAATSGSATTSGSAATGGSARTGSPAGSPPGGNPMSSLSKC